MNKKGPSGNNKHFPKPKKFAPLTGALNLTSSHPEGHKHLSVKNQSARFIAVAILGQWENTGGSPGPIIDKMLQQGGISDNRDRQLVMALVYGVVRWQGFLDMVLAKFSSHPLRKMQPLTLQTLRVGLYQLMFMDRVPVSAAINETVEVLKKNRQPKWLIGFVNGVLRTIARKRADLPGPREDQSLLASFPAWLVRRWQQRYGLLKTVAICRAGNELPIVTLRVNTRLISPADFLELLRNAGVAALAGNFDPEAVRLPDFKGDIINIPGYRQGLFQFQDEAPQLATRLLGPFAVPGTYLDGCAGLGGKTSHLAAMLAGEGQIVAVEPDPGRLKLLKENLERLQLQNNVEIIHGLLEQVDLQGHAPFNGILIDAPCSGSGVISRHPDIRWNRQESDLQRYREKQLALLESAAEWLAASGVLVYATCSTEPEENEEVVAGFLKNHPDFAITNASRHLPEGAAQLVDRQGFFHPTPDQGLDGFFAARLEKH